MYLLVLAVIPVYKINNGSRLDVLTTQHPYTDWMTIHLCLRKSGRGPGPQWALAPGTIRLYHNTYLYLFRSVAVKMIYWLQSHRRICNSTQMSFRQP